MSIFKTVNSYLFEKPLEIYQIENIAKLLTGDKIVCGDKDMNVYEKNLYDFGLVSIPNPNQCGIKDKYLVHLLNPINNEVQ